MSSDPFADLGRRLDDFAQALRDLLNSNQLPAPGSIADKEADGEPYAGEWGEYPSRDVFATMVLTSWSCADHLAGMATLLQTKRCIPSLYTLARGAAEAAVIACYLSEVGIDPLERVRRNMNCNLDALCEDLNILRRFTSPEAPLKAAEHEAKIKAIEHTAKQHDWTFKKQDSYRPAYIGEKPESATTLIGKCALQIPNIGIISYKMFCGVAHAKLHGLSRFLMHNGTSLPGQTGRISVELNITAGELAQQLFAAIACASTLVNHLRYYLGWDTEKIDDAATKMMGTWGRVAGIPFLGPSLR
jgi:hypothetical protein